MSIERLTKENFLNELREIYPEAIDHFCNWIDDYKRQVRWNALFIGGIKFHDLPYEMQMGIMNRFFIEAFASKEEFALPGRAKEYRDEMEYAIKKLNIKLSKS